MTFYQFLKALLMNFVDVYKLYFLKTIRIAFLFTILCFVVAIALNSFADYDAGYKLKPVSILSFFFIRYSYNETYSLVDLVKTCFIFFVSIFSINLYRNLNNNTAPIKLINKITFKDVFYLLLILITCSVLDCALFRLEGQLKPIVSNHHFYTWIKEFIFLLRIYAPIILFSLVIQICISKRMFSFKNIAFLFVSIWICNEMAYELTTFARVDVFGLLLSPVNSYSMFFVLESILGLGLISLFVLGYYCSMVIPFTIEAENKSHL